MQQALIGSVSRKDSPNNDERTPAPTTERCRQPANPHGVSRKPSPDARQQPVPASNKPPVPEKSHLMQPICPASSHLGLRSVLFSPGNCSNPPSRIRSPLQFEQHTSANRPAAGSREINSRNLSPLHRHQKITRPRTRSRQFLNWLTGIPEPHHSTIPQFLTRHPVKLHLTPRKPAPGKGLPWR